MENNLDSFFPPKRIYLTVEEGSGYRHMKKGVVISNRTFTAVVCLSVATRMLHTVNRINVLTGSCRAEHSAKLLKVHFLVKQKSISLWLSLVEVF